MPKYRDGKGRSGTGDVATDYLFKPSPPFVAGLTLGIADATATLVAKLEIEQFLAIRLEGKVVAGPCMMAMAPCVLYRGVEPRSRTGGAAGKSSAGAIDTAMKTFHEWLAVREGLWLMLSFPRFR